MKHLSPNNCLRNMSGFGQVARLSILKGLVRNSKKTLEKSFMPYSLIFLPTKLLPFYATAENRKICSRPPTFLLYLKENLIWVKVY